MLKVHGRMGKYIGSAWNDGKWTGSVWHDGKINRRCMEGWGKTQEVHGIVGDTKRKYMEAWGSAKEVPGRMGKLKVGRGPGYACTLSSL